ncbi:mediator of RNA polymerase II transcription subunit 15-like [Spodoptera litura]|uniref:Mediator of RNA polymerase II transcription subunit 15-like n=1 Tax=Spodoptera litura TaxID=69820 RepID=A0A9J7J1T1_SPOLT|nr:mediator of RNA polymerase II transcription subunit 15-like [Spodoptera litura]
MEPPPEAEEPPLQCTTTASVTPKIEEPQVTSENPQGGDLVEIQGVEDPQDSLEDPVKTANVVCLDNSQEPSVESLSESHQQPSDDKPTADDSSSAQNPQQPPEEPETASVAEATDNLQRPPDIVGVTMKIENPIIDTDNSTSQPEDNVANNSLEKEETSKPPDVVMSTNETKQPTESKSEIETPKIETTANEQDLSETTEQKPEKNPENIADVQVASRSNIQPEVCAATASKRKKKRSKDQRPTSTRKKEPSTRAKIASIIKAWKKGQRRRRARERMTRSLVRKMLGPGFWRDVTASDLTEASASAVRHAAPTSTITRPYPSPPPPPPPPEEHYYAMMRPRSPIYQPYDYSQAHCSRTMPPYATPISNEPLCLKASTSTSMDRPSTSSAFTALRPGSVSEVIVLDDDSSDSEKYTPNIGGRIKYTPPYEMAEDMRKIDRAKDKRKAPENQNDLQQELERNKKLRDMVNKEMEPHLHTPVQTLGAAGICGIFTTPLPSLMEEDG